MLGAILTIQIRKRRRNRVMVVEVCCCIDWLIELASIQKQKSPLRSFLKCDLVLAMSSLLQIQEIFDVSYNLHRKVASVMFVDSVDRHLAVATQPSSV